MPDLLDQLDDPIPFTVTPELVDAVRARGARLRRRRRTGLVAGAVPVLLVLALIAGAAYVDHRSDQVTRLDIAAGVLATPAAGEPYNILLVGTDGPPLDASDGGGPRGDTQMIVHIDRSAGTVRVLSLPRDLVPPTATSGTERLNNAIAQGGPEALVQAVHDRLGLEIAHYVEIDFTGFERLVNLTGPVRVQSSTPIRDANTGLLLDTTCQHLDGEQALGLVRARHVEYLDADGHWQIDPTGDLGRTQRQQVVLSILFGQVTHLTDDLGTLDGLLDVFADNTTIDAGFSRAAILDLARWGRGLDPAAIAMTTLPTEPIVLPDGAAVLRPAPEAAAAVEVFDGRVAPPAPDTTVTVTLGQLFTITSC
jgi:LCP family protein required for cell wall assembly